MEGAVANTFQPRFPPPAGQSGTEAAPFSTPWGLPDGLLIRALTQWPGCCDVRYEDVSGWCVLVSVCLTAFTVRTLAPASLLPGPFLPIGEGGVGSRAASGLGPWWPLRGEAHPGTRHPLEEPTAESSCPEAKPVGTLPGPPSESHAVAASYSGGGGQGLESRERRHWPACPSS